MFLSQSESSIGNSQATSHVQTTSRPATAYQRPKTSVETIKKMTESDKLDEQLRYGTDYVNLPPQYFPIDRAPTWIPEQEPVNDTQMKPPEIRYLHHLRPSTMPSQISRDHYTDHQQMDAENRLQQLEVIRPKENINLLNVKYHTLQHPRHARPVLPQYRDDYVNTLYDQVGSYVQERAGLYHTETYEPHALAQAMPELENQQENYKDDSHFADLGYKTKSKLFQNKTLGDYQNMRNHLLNKLHVSNDARSINSRVQEGNKQFVQCESVYGQSYNTPKFLQENALPSHGRADPSRLMSTRYNHNLQRVRSLNSYPIKATDNSLFNTQQTNQPLSSPVLRPATYDDMYSTKYIGEHTNGYSRRSTTRVYDSPFKNEYDTNLNQYSIEQEQQKSTNSIEPIPLIPYQLPRSAKTVLRLPGPEIVARFLEPKFIPQTSYQRSFKDISYQEIRPHTQVQSQRTAPSQDKRLKQLKLRDIQDRWSKSQAQEQYRLEYPEVVPDTGGNTIRAKKEILVADTIRKREAMMVR